MPHHPAVPSSGGPRLRAFGTLPAGTLCLACFQHALWLSGLCPDTFSTDCVQVQAWLSQSASIWGKNAGANIKVQPRAPPSYAVVAGMRVQLAVQCLDCTSRCNASTCALLQGPRACHDGTKAQSKICKCANARKALHLRCHSWPRTRAIHCCDGHQSTLATDGVVDAQVHAVSRVDWRDTALCAKTAYGAETSADPDEAYPRQ